MLLEQDLQLSRLRNTPDNITSPSVNIDYGCDGLLNGHMDVKSLPQVNRERVRLIKYVHIFSYHNYKNTALVVE